MSKIISFIIKFLNRINKFIWKIIISLSKFIKVDEVNRLDDKPDDDKCPFYLKNKSSLNTHDKKLYQKHPEKIKLRYIYRKFNIDLPTLQKDYREFVKSHIDLSRAYSSQYIIGLCLTYHVNYGLSYRQTASILKDVHEVYISYKTVENYCKAAYSTLIKYDTLPKSLKVISDGNPIYNVAVQYWTQNGLPFNLYQVIGLTNQDDISKKYRSEKQIIERFNRTLKYYYRPKGGFSSLDNANSYMVLFASYNNFLRPNKALEWKTPIQLNEINGISSMPNKWIELINLDYNYSDIYC